jgi:acyl-coenzyme A synthetase/AMP-(fatty) acid ligase
MRLTISDVYRLADFLECNGVCKKDYVACFMTNSPEMVVTVLAFSKLGAVGALVNINLRGLSCNGQIPSRFQLT